MTVMKDTGEEAKERKKYFGPCPGIHFCHNTKQLSLRRNANSIRSCLPSKREQGQRQTCLSPPCVCHLPQPGPRQELSSAAIVAGFKENSSGLVIAASHRESEIHLPQATVGTSFHASDILHGYHTAHLATPSSPASSWTKGLQTLRIWHSTCWA